LIVGKIEEAREELISYQDQINEYYNMDGSEGKFKGLEDGSTTTEKERLSDLVLIKQKHINNLENALIRIKNKVYGICRETGKLIPKERLYAVPHATLSIEAKSARK
jgi:RNA polymerase-binding transcription factor DksA